MHSLNFKIKRFINYLVLNLSTHHKFIREIGVKIENKLVLVTLRTEADNFDKANVALSDIYKVPGMQKEQLDQDGVNFESHCTEKKFDRQFIQQQSSYYFTPETTKSRFIYKYLPVNINLFKLLINNKLWFSDPACFNDPFDSRFSIDADPQDIEVAQFYYRQALKTSGIENLQFEDFYKTFKEPTKRQFLNDLENHHFKNSLSRKLGVCCFSEKHNNHLLWSHYSDNVKGVCLVFDWRLSSEESYYSFKGDKVKYRNSIIRRFYDATGVFDVTEIMYSKYKEWSYEQEIRELKYFENGSTDRTVIFDPRCLVGVIFGPKITQENKKTITRLVDQLEKYNLELIDSSIDLTSHSIKVSKNKLGLK